MDQISSCEANISSVSLEIPRSLWNTNVHYPLHSSPRLVPDLS